MTRHAKRTDSNHKLIRDGLRKAGREVLDLSGIGFGIPDLLVRKDPAHHASWVEVKMPGEELTNAEKKLREWLPGRYDIVHSLEEALEIWA